MHSHRYNCSKSGFHWQYLKYNVLALPLPIDSLSSWSSFPASASLPICLPLPHIFIPPSFSTNFFGQMFGLLVDLNIIYFCPNFSFRFLSPQQLKTKYLQSFSSSSYLFCLTYCFCPVSQIFFNLFLCFFSTFTVNTCTNVRTWIKERNSRKPQQRLHLWFKIIQHWTSFLFV